MATYDLSINNRENDPALVHILKLWLNAVGAVNARTPLTVDQTFDQATARALRTFQGQHNLPVNGVCGIRTWQSLCRQVRRQARAELTIFPMRRWLINLLTRGNTIEGGRITVDRTLFMTMYRTEAPNLGTTDADISALNTLLDFFAADGEVADLRWMAYMLATVRHECFGWVPREEGNGAAQTYGREIEAECPPGSGRTSRNRYFGRGYVQVTHLEKYREVDDHFGLNCRLVHNPGLLIDDPQLSYNAMSWGMRAGIYRGDRQGRHTLARYLHDDTTEYLNARAVVNGDRDTVHRRNTQSNGQIIAGYALKFEPIIRACCTN